MHFSPLPCLGLSVAGEGRASDGFDIDGGGGFFGLFYRKKNENIQSSYQFCHINHMHNWKICKFFPGIPLYSMVHRILIFNYSCMWAPLHVHTNACIRAHILPSVKRTVDYVLSD